MGQGANAAESPGVAVNGHPVVRLDGAAVIKGLLQYCQRQAQGFAQCGGFALGVGGVVGAARGQPPACSWPMDASACTSLRRAAVKFPRSM